MRKISPTYIAFAIVLILGLSTSVVTLFIVDGSCEKSTDTYLDEYIYSDDFWRDINTIHAHDEQDTVIGNFTGCGIDTLYIVSERDENEYMCTAFYMACTNKQIPRIKLYGIAMAPPKLVLEKDLDGNGTDEVGYLHTYINSRWRHYNIFTLVNYEWRNLVDSEFLDTSDWFRNTGTEVAEPGPEVGTILLHYYYVGYNDTTEEFYMEMRDTIVLPSFSKIVDVE